MNWLTRKRHGSRPAAFFLPRATFFLVSRTYLFRGYKDSW